MYVFQSFLTCFPILLYHIPYSLLSVSFPLPLSGESWTICRWRARERSWIFVDVGRNVGDAGTTGQEEEVLPSFERKENPQIRSSCQKKKFGQQENIRDGTGSAFDVDCEFFLSLLGIKNFLQWIWFYFWFSLTTKNLIPSSFPTGLVLVIELVSCLARITQVVVKTVEVKVTDPKLLEEVDSLKEKVRTAETIWNDLEIQNTSLRKQLAAAQQQVQVSWIVRCFGEDSESLCLPSVLHFSRSFLSQFSSRSRCKKRSMNGRRFSVSPLRKSKRPSLILTQLPLDSLMLNPP